MLPTTLDPKLRFTADHLLSFTAGAVIGGLVSETPEGVVAGGVLNAMITSKFSIAKQFLAAVAFGGVKIISSNFFNRDFTALTPLLLAFLGEKYAPNAAELTVASLRFGTDFFSHVFSYITSTSFSQSYLKPAWELAGDTINLVFQYRIAQGIGLLLMGYALISNSKEKAEQVALTDPTRELVIASKAEITPYKGNILSVIAAPLTFFVDFRDLWLEATAINYITAQKFGNAFWVIPPIALFFWINQKYQFFYSAQSEELKSRIHLQVS